MPKETPKQPKKGRTGKFMQQGHTAGPYGNDPNADAKGEAGRPPRDLRP